MKAVISLEPQYNYHRRLRGREASTVPDRDLDTLLILDACRYDSIERLN